MKKKIVYIAHPVATDEKFTTDENVKDILRILNYVNFYFREDVVPIAPYIGDVLCMKDSIPRERRKGIDNGVAIIETGIFDELWLTGHKISLGMQEEVNMFKLQGKTIINLIDKI